MKELIKISIFNKFSDIPNLENLKNKIPIFATQEYADYLYGEKKLKTIWFVSGSFNKVDFIIPFGISKKHLFTKGQFLTAVNNLKDASIDKENEFLECVVQQVKEKKLCDWIQQGPNWAIFRSIPKGAIYAEFGTYKINLKEKTEEELFNSIRTKDRGDVRKAIKENVIIKKGINHLNDSLLIINNTLSTAGISIIDSQKVERIYRYLSQNLLIYVAYNEKDIPQSSVIFYSNDFSTYAIFAGSIKRPNRGATTYLYWEAIKTAKANNVNYFDFVGARINPEHGSKQERIQKFKEHFGVELYKGYIWKMPMNKFKYCLYQLGIKFYFKIKNKEYRGDIIDQELKRLSK